MTDLWVPLCILSIHIHIFLSLHHSSRVFNIHVFSLVETLAQVMVAMVAPVAVNVRWHHEFKYFTIKFIVPTIF